MSRTERRTIGGLAVAGVLLLVAACSGTLVPPEPTPSAPTAKPTAPARTPAAPADTPAAPASTPAAPAETAAASPSRAPVAAAVDLAVQTAPGKDQFSYVQTALMAPAGSKIKLTFSNKTNPDDEIGHNWVLVMAGKEESVLASGNAAGDDADWLDDNDPGIIAATRLIEGNSKDTVTFDAPPPGTYTFMCTFPKHYAGGMTGTLTIE
jgi:azurin